MKESQPRTIYLKDYRPPAFLIDETHLRFQLYEDGARVTSRLVMRRNPQSENPAADLTLDGEELKLERLVLDGRELQASEYALSEDALTIRRLPDSFVLNVVTWILPQENTRLEGLYRSSHMFCTQCEAEGFRRITYYLDRPDVMSVFTTTIEADKAEYPVLLSNGNPVAEGENNERHWVTWEDPFKKPCYLFALVAGDLKFVESEFTTMSGRDVQIRVYVEERDLDRCDHAIDSLKHSMAWDEKVYGREYDLDIFNIVAVSDFNMGAMENKGLNIFNSSCVLANPKTATDAAFQRVEAIVAHEYFHNWSGNRVTCRDWFQLSLKEGFTVFRDAEFTADMHSRTVKRIEDANLLRTAQFAEDGGPMAHPIRPETYMEISNFYTLTVYEKGAEVVRMLHTILGPDLFRQGTDLYFDRHDGQAVTTEDFVACMESVSGRDFSQFKRWYSQAGTPVLEVKDDYDADQQQYRLKIRQYCPPTPGQSEKQPFHIPIGIGLLSMEDGSQGQPIKMKTADSRGVTEQGENWLYELKDAEETIVFEEVAARPVPSLLRNFSAPVKLNYDYSRDQLRFLMAYDADEFNRWDAGQRLALLQINDLVQAVRNEEELSSRLDEDYLDAYREVLEAEGIDPAMHAKLLAIPSTALVAEQSEVIFVRPIIKARDFLMLKIVERFESLLLEIYKNHQQSHEEPADMSSAAMGIRSLKNTALMLLSAGGSERAGELAQAQYRNASNMTDELAALQALILNPTVEDPEQSIADFDQKWRHDAVVMDSWFSAQAGSKRMGALAQISELLEHPVFTEKNPNKVRAVVGVFAGQNWEHFHAEDGEGYRFLTQWVLKMDAINPQIASRLVTPLTRWRRYDEAQGAQMRQALQEIMQASNLSKDLYEVVSKSL